jgi:hypothetical protein
LPKKHPIKQLASLLPWQGRLAKEARAQRLSPTLTPDQVCKQEREARQLLEWEGVKQTHK